MKTIIRTTRLGRELGVITSVMILLGGAAVGGAPAVIVNETFDHPNLLGLFGWRDATSINVTRQYVNTGVQGSTAVQMSADFLDYGGYVATVFYQNDAVVGNDLATPQNTVLTFDVKVEQPGLVDLEFGLQSWGGFAWDHYLPPGTPFTASRGRIPLGAYVPGTFKTVSVSVADPLWIEEPYTGPLSGPFDPSGKTYQIWFQVDSWSLPAPGQVTVTIDNVRLVTQNAMVPWKAASTGQVFYDLATGAFNLEETGVATYLGSYAQSTVVYLAPDWGWSGDIEITAADGSKLTGFLSDISDTEVGVAITGGTGRFQGAKGSYLETIAWGPTPYTATSMGRLSSIGLNTQ